LYKSQPYVVIEPPTEYPLSVADFKLWAKVTGTADDPIIDRLIKGVTLEAERYTKREITKKTFRTFRDIFGDLEETPVDYRSARYFEDVPVTIRRSPLLSITEITYNVAGVPIALDLDDIDIVYSDDFSSLIPAIDKVWKQVDNRPQSIKIEFEDGFETAADVPSDLKNALLAHITAVYQNRGDCDSGGSCDCKFAPAEALAVYKQYRINDFRA
jgi:uncharacterized phiE125 gp8 family phage protein